MNSNLLRVLMITATLLFSVGANISIVYAADEKPALTSTKDKQSLEALEKALANIEQQRQAIKDLQARVAKSDGFTKKAYEARLDKAWLELLQQNLSFAKSVAAMQDAGVDISRFRKQAIDILASQYDVGIAVVKRTRSRIDIPEPGLSAAEQAAAYTRIFNMLESTDQAYELLLQSLEMSKQFEINVAKQEALLKEDLAERAANGSILLEMAMNDVTALRASVSAVPDDAELKAKLTVAANHVRSLADGLATVLAMMDSLEMDAAAYQQQVLTATGQITADVFEVGVVTSLLVGWGEKLWNVMIEDGPNLLFKILLFIVIVYGFRKLADFVKNIVERALEKSHLKLSELLRRMLVSIVRNLIIILGILIALSQIGISLGPLLAGLGVIGFVVGFALQDSLSNFAAGMLILMYRPFDVGDLIEAGGVSGKVSKMNLVNTTILTLDNQTIVVPNNKIWGDVVKNVTAQTMRRIDMMFGISYTDDIPKTERVLQEILDSHEKVLAEPEPIVRLHELADSSVNFVVRPWVKKDDYWDVYWDITRSVKMRFDEEGISIPFPQRDVHLYSEK
ncbi:MAG: mechanosensitive ion channel family protein [Gammaproteobacteria bacterium]|nr:mechanosensitive ion channel family protein [Gammaproteobacteria bacterium]